MTASDCANYIETIFSGEKVVLTATLGRDDRNWAIDLYVYGSLAKSGMPLPVKELARAKKMWEKWTAQHHHEGIFCLPLQDQDEDERIGCFIRLGFVVVDKDFGLMQWMPATPKEMPISDRDWCLVYQIESDAYNTAAAQLG